MICQKIIETLTPGSLGKYKYHLEDGAEFISRSIETSIYTSKYHPSGTFTKLAYLGDYLVNHINSKSCTIQYKFHILIYNDEDNYAEPHFHLVDHITGKDICISLNHGTYYPHNAYDQTHIDIFDTAYDTIQLDKFLNEPAHKDSPITRWQELVNTYQNLNNTIVGALKQPNYSDLAIYIKRLEDEDNIYGNI